MRSAAKERVAADYYLGVALPTFSIFMIDGVITIASVKISMTAPPSKKIV
jgi:hypothetical protein